MNGPESKPRAWPMWSPSLRSAPVREAARRSPNRSAVIESGGRSRCRSSKGATCSAGKCVPGGLHKLPDAIELVCLGRGMCRARAQRSQPFAHAVDVGPDLADDSGVLPARGRAVDREQLGEVIQRRERVGGDLLERSLLVEALVDQLALDGGRVGVRVDAASERALAEQ